MVDRMLYDNDTCSITLQRLPNGVEENPSLLAAEVNLLAGKTLQLGSKVDLLRLTIESAMEESGCSQKSRTASPTA